MRLLLLIIILIFGACRSEQEPGKLRLFTLNDIYDWRDCVKPSQEYIKVQVPIIRKHVNEYIANIDSLENFLHFIDLNNDKIPDVIYSGVSGSEIDCVIFLLNTGKDYKILFEEYSNIRELKFDNHYLVGYTGLNFGCCAEYVYKETKYSVSLDWKRAVIYQRAITNYTKLPKEISGSPRKFIVGNDLYKLRSTPAIDDTTIYIYDSYSNVVSTYRKGAVGYAWAETKDNTGRTWWFVEMEPTDKQTGSKLNSKFDTIPVTNLGWMSSRYLKEIK
jgi:hypothetical protein